MSCRINLNERGEVESVNTPEGNISQVFNELSQKFGTEKALELYSVTDDEAFKAGQEVKKSIQADKLATVYRGINGEFSDDHKGTQYFSVDERYAGVFGKNVKKFLLDTNNVVDLGSWNKKMGTENVDGFGPLFTIDRDYIENGYGEMLYYEAEGILEDNGHSKEDAIRIVDEFKKELSKAQAVFGEDVGNRNTKVYAIKDSSLIKSELNSEPSIEDIINYATQQEEVLSVQDEIDLSNAMNNLGLTYYGQVETIMESNLFKDGVLVFTEKNLKNSGLYNAYEINYILNSIEAQNNIRRTLQALKTTENKEIPAVNSNFIVTTSKINILGKQETLNPFTVEEEVIKAIAGKDLNVSLDDIPYDSIKNRYKKDKFFKEELDNIAKNNRSIQAKKIDGEQLVDKTTNNNKELFKKTVDFSNKEGLLSQIYYLASITPEVWRASLNEIHEVLKDLNIKAIDSGIDMQDLEAQTFIKSQGEILSFLRETSNLLEEPTDENMDDFYKKYSDFFNVVEEPSTETVETKDDTNIHLDTDLSEYELFNKYGLIKERGDVYKEITPLETLESAYEVLFSNKDKIPSDIETIEDLKDYVNKLTAEYETEDFNVNQDDLQNLIIHKIYFDSPMREYKPMDRDGRTRVSEFKTDYKYMTEEYPSDFYKEYLKEKRAGSEEFKNFYSKFTIGERGITLKNNDPITLDTIKMYSGEAFEQYNLVSKHLGIPIEQPTDSILVEEVQYNREYAISNPSSVKKLKGDFITLSDKTIAVRNEVENIVKTPTGLYEIDYQSGDVVFYNKLPEGNPNYNSYGQHKSKTFSDVNVTKYSEMEITPESFIKAKNYYTQKELQKINDENFNC